MLTYYKLGPYVLELESPRRVTMNTDGENIDYFKAEAARTDVPYQVIINMYLTESRMQKRHLAVAYKIPRASRLGAIGAPSAARGGIRPGDPGNLVPALPVVFLRYRP